MYIYVVEITNAATRHALDYYTYWELSEDLLDSLLTASPRVSHWDRFTIDNTSREYHVYEESLEGDVRRDFGSYEGFVAAVYAALQNLKNTFTWKEVPNPDLKALELDLQEYTKA